MKSDKWNISKALVLGAAIGFAYTTVSQVTQGLSVANIGELIGLAIGGATGGALLFGVVTLVRNAFVK